jgi:hypothetical protein
LSVEPCQALLLEDFSSQSAQTYSSLRNVDSSGALKDVLVVQVGTEGKKAAGNTVVLSSKSGKSNYKM